LARIIQDYREGAKKRRNSKSHTLSSAQAATPEEALTLAQLHASQSLLRPFAPSRLNNPGCSGRVPWVSLRVLGVSAVNNPGAARGKGEIVEFSAFFT
jgi:hypothetical protein